MFVCVCMCIHGWVWLRERVCVCALFVVVVVIAGGFVLKFVVRSIVYFIFFQAGKILFIHKDWVQRCVRFVTWGLVLVGSVKCDALFHEASLCKMLFSNFSLFVCVKFMLLFLVTFFGSIYMSACVHVCERERESLPHLPPPPSWDLK